MDGAQQMKCVYCGAKPDSGGVVRHAEHCTLRVIGQSVPTQEKEYPPQPGFMGPMLRKPDSSIETRIREICREEIVKNSMQAQAYQGLVEQAKSCETCSKLRTMLGMARSALKKVAGMDPQAAAQRAQMIMPAEHDIAKMTLREIERMEAEGGVEGG